MKALETPRTQHGAGRLLGVERRVFLLEQRSIARRRIRGLGLDGASSTNAEGGGPLPGPPPAVGSIDGDTHAPLEVVNASPCPIDMWWVDYDVEEEYLGTVAPGGGTWTADTWETHPWRIRLTGSEVLLREIPPVSEGGDASLRTVVYP
jgi:hypothetical protein